MKIHRFFLDQPLGEEIILKEKDLVHQFKNVLKFKKGETLIFFNSGHESSSNFDYLYQIEDLEKTEISLSFISKVPNLNQNQIKNKVNLCVSLIKKENLDLILEKCTEIGVFSFTPIVSDRVEKKNVSSFHKERVEKIIKEATEQSGWGNVPVLNDPVNLKKFLENKEKDNELDKVVVLDISDNKEKGQALYLKEIYLLIGPEGGWTESERELFRSYKLEIVSFGENILRAETAAMVGSFEYTKK